MPFGSLVACPEVGPLDHTKSLLWYSTVLQGIVAPFVLENLGCIGNETQLVDCPVATGDDVGSSDEDGGGTCDPFRGNGGTFVRVACGTSTAAGARSCPVGTHVNQHCVR